MCGCAGETLLILRDIFVLDIFWAWILSWIVTFSCRFGAFGSMFLWKMGCLDSLCLSFACLPLIAIFALRFHAFLLAFIPPFSNTGGTRNQLQVSFVDKGLLLYTWMASFTRSGAIDSMFKLPNSPQFHKDPWVAANHLQDFKTVRRRAFAGADCSLRDDDDASLVHLALEAGGVQAACALVQNGALVSTVEIGFSFIRPSGFCFSCLFHWFEWFLFFLGSCFLLFCLQTLRCWSWFARCSWSNCSVAGCARQPPWTHRGVLATGYRPHSRTRATQQYRHD